MSSSIFFNWFSIYLLKLELKWERFPCFWKCSIITHSSFYISGIFSCSFLFFLNNFKIFQNSFGFYSYYQRELKKKLFILNFFLFHHFFLKVFTQSKILLLGLCFILFPKEFISLFVSYITLSDHGCLYFVFFFLPDLWNVLYALSEILCEICVNFLVASSTPSWFSVILFNSNPSISFFIFSSDKASINNSFEVFVHLYVFIFFHLFSSNLVFVSWVLEHFKYNSIWTWSER